MIKRILIALNNDFLRNTYEEVFKAESGFEILSTKDGNEALKSIQNEKLDLIMVDISLSGIGGFDLIAKIKEEGKNIPVIIMDQYENKENKEKAMELEARDFIATSSASPNEILRKIKIVLGEQKSYRIKISDIEEARILYNDLGYSSDFKCPQCGSIMELNLIRDLSKGNNYFLVSFVCPNNCV